MKALAICLLFISSFAGNPLTAESSPPYVEARAAAARLDAALAQALAAQAENQKTRSSPAPPIVVPPAVDDPTFLRRLSVDLLGRLPSAGELRVFLADQTPDKRERLIGIFIGQSEAAGQRFQRMADALRVKDAVMGVSQQPYMDWLRTAFIEDRPWPDIISDLFTAEGTLAENPATGFILGDSGCAQVTATESVRAFLGETIHCAGCHDDPFGDTTQRQYFELAASFAVTRLIDSPPSKSPAFKPLIPGAKRVGQEKVAVPGNPVVWPQLAVLDAATARKTFPNLRLSPISEGMILPRYYLYSDGKPGDAVTPNFPDFEKETPRTLQPSPGPQLALDSKKVRSRLAQWFTHGNRERMDNMSALRVWSWMFGLPALARADARRLSDGPGTPTTPQEVQKQLSCSSPSSTSLIMDDWLRADRSTFLAALRLEFQRCGRRLGRFQQILAYTQAYQRQAMIPPGGEGSAFEGFLPAPLVRRLPAEVVWDKLVACCPPAGSTESQLPSAQLPQVLPEEHPLRILGRGSREWADESIPALSHNVARLMITSPLIGNATAADSALLASARTRPEPEKQVEQLFLDTLGRVPLESERDVSLARLRESPTTALLDLAWALLNTREFLFHH